MALCVASPGPRKGYALSVKQMAMVWDCAGLDASERLVMLSLADHADEDGICYPSVARLVAKTSLSERTVQAVIKRLVARGFVAVEYNAGRKGCNLFQITTTPATAAPPQPLHPRKKRNGPPQNLHPTPATAAPEPSGTIIEPSVVTPFGSPAEKPHPKARLPDDWSLSDEGWAYARSKQIPDEDIADEARGFHVYWSDRSDKDARKSARGWEQCWQGWVRRIAGRYRSRSGVAVAAFPGGSGRGGGIASIAARRRAQGQF